MSLSERKKQELRALALATNDALIALAKYTRARHEVKPVLRNLKRKK